MNPTDKLEDQSQPIQPVHEAEVHRYGPVRRAVAIGLAGLALGAAAEGAIHPATAEARPAARTAIVPNVKGDTLAEANSEARDAGLKVTKAVNVGKDKHLDPGEEKIAGGLEARTTVKRKVHGKLIPRKIFRLMRPGKRVPRGTLVRTRYEIESRDGAAPLPGTSPENPQSPVGTGPETPTAPEFNLGAETDKFLKENAGIFPLLEGCSALAVRNSAGVAVGFASATHCLDTSRLETDASGNQTLITDQPLVIRNGDRESELQDIAEVDRLLVADGQSANGEDNDLTIAVVKGQSTQDAINSYTSKLISDQTLQNLAGSDPVVSRGYPLDLPNNPNAPRVAQKLTGNVIGRVNVTTNLYPKLPTIMVGYNPGTSGPTCAPGYSGAIGIITQEGTNPDGSKRLITYYLGPDSAIDDFRKPPFNVYSNWDPVYANKDIFTERKNQFGFTTELDSYKNGVVCYFNNRLPTKWKTIKLKSTYAQVQSQGLSAAPPPSRGSLEQKLPENRVLSVSKEAE